MAEAGSSASGGGHSSSEDRPELDIRIRNVIARPELGLGQSSALPNFGQVRTTVASRNAT